MVRRIASQVHQQAARLLRANYLQKEPVWYQAVLEYPPLTLPPKAPPPRTAYDRKPDRKQKKLHEHSTRPLPIYYLEDDIRRQFFTDHPFEAKPGPIAGTQWTRLRQRGRNPTSEDAIQYALNLYQYHSVTLSEAYSRAVAQFRALRSEHHIATTFAAMEAEALGSTFGPSEIERTMKCALAARKRWKAIIEKIMGETYVRLWQNGTKPNYMASLAPTPTPTIPPTQPAVAETVKSGPKPLHKTADFMGVKAL
ncbi:mitochondrial ribosomal protein S25-domain-containing protein [Flammula alnicola]|nr:mitochondrial ribosomal protein S25-domain-containing protein [Flammula alnicola]